MYSLNFHNTVSKNLPSAAGINFNESDEVELQFHGFNPGALEESYNKYLDCELNWKTCIERENLKIESVNDPSLLHEAEYGQFEAFDVVDSANEVVCGVKNFSSSSSECSSYFSESPDDETSEKCCTHFKTFNDACTKRYKCGRCTPPLQVMEKRMHTMGHSVNDRQLRRMIPGYTAVKYNNNNHSSLTSEDMNFCFEQMQLMSSTSQTRKSRDTNRMLKSLQKKIREEQIQYKEFANNLWNTFNHSKVFMINPQVEKWIDHFWKEQVKCVLNTYPNCYKFLSSIPTIKPTPGEIVMNLIEPIPQSRKEVEVSFPNLGYLQFFERAHGSFPNILLTDDAISTCILKKKLNTVAVTKDKNAEILAKEQNCDVVMSASAFSRLLDNRPRNMHRESPWSIPFTVKEYQNGKKILYMDKPLPSADLLAIEKSQWFSNIARRKLISVFKDCKGREFENFDIFDYATLFTYCYDNKAGWANNRKNDKGLNNSMDPKVRNKKTNDKEDIVDNTNIFDEKGKKREKLCKSDPKPKNIMDEEILDENQLPYMNILHETGLMDEEKSTSFGMEEDDGEFVEQLTDFDYSFKGLFDENWENTEKNMLDTYSYTKWEMKSQSTSRVFNIITRAKVDELLKDENGLYYYLTSKLEHQPEMGSNASTLSECIKYWTKLTLRQNCNLAKVRFITPGFEVYSVEKLQKSNIVEECMKFHQVNPKNLMTYTYQVLQHLTNLPQGQYMLTYKPGSNHFADIFTSHNSCSEFDLSKIYADVMNDKFKQDISSLEVPECPCINPDVLTPYHRVFHQVPATFPVARVKSGEGTNWRVNNPPGRKPIEKKSTVPTKKNRTKKFKKK